MSIITYMYSILLLCNMTSYAAQSKTYTIMLDPAGDAQHTGRIIGSSFERALMLQLAQTLQHNLQATGRYSVIITRSPGETVYPLQNANFSNRLPIDLYISLHCYHAPHEKHIIALYMLASGTTSPSRQLAMIPVTNAHMQSCTTTKKYATQMHATLTSLYAHQFQILPIIAIPCAPLRGIIAPAISIEINCTSSDDVSLYSEPLIKMILDTIPS